MPTITLNHNQGAPYGQATILDNVINNATLSVDGGLFIRGDLAGPGLTDVHGDGASLVLYGIGGSEQHIALEAGSLMRDFDPHQLLCDFSGWQVGGELALASTTLTGASYSNGVLTVTNGSLIEATLHAPGHTLSDFAFGTHDVGSLHYATITVV